MNGENKPIRMAFDVSHQRIQYYDDVIDYMSRNEINRCKSKEGFIPNNDQIAFYKKELIRALVINKNFDKANLVKIQKSNILNETYDSLHTRT